MDLERGIGSKAPKPSIDSRCTLDRMSEISEQAEKADWRNQVARITNSTIDPATGKTIPDGSLLTLAAVMSYKKERVGTSIPNATVESNSAGCTTSP